MIRFSIVIPTYNRALFVGRTIQSVMNQSFENWELIVVDDGSTDDTKRVVSTFNDKRIRYQYQENAERSAARNRGITMAKGQWICFLDSDDEFMNNHLQVLDTFISENQLAPSIISSGMLAKNQQKTSERVPLDLTKNTLTEIGEKFLLPSQVCVHRSILPNEPFDVRFRLWEDTHLWLRIAAVHPIYQTNVITTIQHIHPEGTVVQGMKKVRLTEVRQYIAAIQDLRGNYTALFERKLPANYLTNYTDSKYRMYLYQARQNKQLRISLQIGWKAICHKPSGYFLSEFPKIFLNKLGIGIHEN